MKCDLGTLIYIFNLLVFPSGWRFPIQDLLLLHLYPFYNVLFFLSIVDLLAYRDRKDLNLLLL